ncbi:hypothetical protein WKH56_10675 [Priestia sp. SB1]|uniref:hypothetical protein n=1 Tax=Priestia sp. SB1 TaxID=3132359 RepID=UPI00316C9F0F
MKWTNRDWAWLVGVLTAIIILILTYRLSDNQEVTNLFSFISSSVSIALAIIAIFIALKQDSDGRRVNEQTSFLLNNIESKISNVDENIRKIDVGFISRAQETIESYTDEQDEKDNYTKEEVKQLLDNLGTELLEQVNEELKRFPIINPKVSSNPYVHEYDDSQIREVEAQVIRNIVSRNKDLTPHAVQERMKKLLHREIPIKRIERIIDSMDN